MSAWRSLAACMGYWGRLGWISSRFRQGRLPAWALRRETSRNHGILGGVHPIRLGISAPAGVDDASGLKPVNQRQSPGHLGENGRPMGGVDPKRLERLDRV